MSRTNTSDRIVQYASILFREKGYHAASMNDIAKSVGLKKASLYNHFTSKEMIAKAVVRLIHEEFETQIFSRVFDDGLSVSDRLKDLSNRLLDYYQDKNACILASLSMGEADDKELPIDEIRNLKRLWMDGLSHLIQDRHPKEKADQLAEDFLIRVQGSLIMRRVQKTDPDCLKRVLNELACFLD